MNKNKHNMAVDAVAFAIGHIHHVIDANILSPRLQIAARVMSDIVSQYSYHQFEQAFMPEHLARVAESALVCADILLTADKKNPEEGER